MKYLQIIILIILLSGCEITYQNEYVLKNDTNHNIKIKAYCRSCDEDYLQKSERISIAPHSSYSVSKLAGFHAEPRGVFHRNEIDSISIVFDGERLITQYCDNWRLELCEIDRNLMNYESEYTAKKIGRSSGQKEYRYTYTFTEDDYENAIQIEK